MNWQKDKLTIIGFGVIFIVLGIFGYILWNITREPIAEIPVQDTPVVTDIPKPVEEDTKLISKQDKVSIYTELSKLGENDIVPVKILQTINSKNIETLADIKLYVPASDGGIPLGLTLSPDKKNLLIQYSSSADSDKLQLVNFETKEVQDILITKLGLDISSAKFSPDSKQVFFLKSTPKYNDQGGRLTVTYDFNIFTIADKKNEIIKTVKTRSQIFDPRWLPDNRILLTYALETTREKPESKYEINSLNLADKKISSFPNKIYNEDSNYSSNGNVLNQDNTLYTKAKTFTTKEFEGCYDNKTTLPNSYGIIETISGKEIVSFKGNPEEPVLPIQFSSDNKEILYTLAKDGCNNKDNAQYYIQSLYDNRSREEVNLDDIIKKWDIIFNISDFAKKEIIYYQ